MLSSRESSCFYDHRCHLLWNKIFYVNATLQEGKSLEAEEFPFLSLPHLYLQNAQNYDEVTISGIKPTHSEEEDKFLGKKNQTHFDSRARRVVWLTSESPHGNNEEISVC